MVVGLDIGRSRLKLVTDGFRDSFPSVIGEGRDLRLSNDWGKEDMEVIWRHKRLLVGNIAKQECDDAGTLQSESKAHNDTLLLGLCALHRVFEDGSRVQMVTGVPITTHSKRERELMKALFLGRHELMVNGVVKRLHIESVDVVPESAAAYFSLARRSECRLIDLGSRTTGYAQIINNRFIDRLSGTLPVGAENFQGSQASYVRYIANELSRRWDLREEIHLIGGMAELMQPAFAEFMPNARVAQDPVYANATAYHQMGLRKCGKSEQTV